MLRVTAPGQPKRRLTREERDKIVTALNGKAPAKNKLTLMALKKLIKLRPDESFSLETAMRDAIACDPVRMSLAPPDRYGPGWSALSTEQQWEIIQRLRDEQDGEKLVDWLVERTGLDRDRAIADAPLPEGFGRLGETATRRILAALIGGTADQEVATYNEAVEFCGWNHSHLGTGEVLDRLSYYGQILDRHVLPGTGEETDVNVTRFARITNPTVHIGLGQIRRLVNGEMDSHGSPHEIVLELARDLKMSEEQKRNLAQTNAKKPARRRIAQPETDRGIEGRGQWPQPCQSAGVGRILDGCAETLLSLYRHDNLRRHALRRQLRYRPYPALFPHPGRRFQQPRDLPQIRKPGKAQQDSMGGLE